MEAVTLIGLMLSLFGGVYAAMSALRAHSEAEIDKTRDEAKVQFEKIQRCIKRAGVQNRNKSFEGAKTYYGKVRFWTGMWKKLHIIPTAFFISFSFFMAVWCLVEWDHMQMPQNWWVWKAMVYTGTAINFLSLILLVVVKYFILGAERIMTTHCDTMLESHTDVSADLVPVESMPLIAQEPSIIPEG